jgi:uncharacterized membrane-anchored protein
MALVILAVVNYAVWQKEQALAAGRTLLLELAPVDPRSLMQGDYMVLNYRLAGDIRARLAERSADGLAVVKVDDQGRARFDHVHEAGDALQPDQALIRFRKRGAVVRIGAEAFFFEEGQAKTYEPAKFGELKVAGDGEVILIGLRDDKLAPLGERLISR